MLMNEENKTAMIALYLQGLLEGEALEEFNSRIAVDEDFKNEVELQRAIVRNISVVGRRELKFQLKQYHQQIVSEMPGYIAEDESPLMIADRGHDSREDERTRGRRKLRWLVAASFIGIMMIAGLRYYAYLSSGNIFKEEFAPYTLSTTRGQGSSQDIASLYRSGDYDTYLVEYKVKRVKSLQEMFLAGNAYLIKGQSSRAIESFSQVIHQNEKLAPDDQRYYEDAEYFLALAYLQNNDPDKAQPIFRKIASSPEHPYHHEVGKGLLWKISVAKFKG
jgi:hypothetical protein